MADNRCAQQANSLYAKTHAFLDSFFSVFLLLFDGSASTSECMYLIYFAHDSDTVPSLPKFLKIFNSSKQWFFFVNARKRTL